jgi:predicted aminopeptidase
MHPVRLPTAFGSLGLLAAAVALALLLSSCYVSSQGLHYLGLLSRAVPARKALADPATPPATRDLLERAAAIRAFATGSLGLRDTRNFRSIVQIEGDTLSSVVQACAELSFERKLWSYPFVGKLPYRGYFDPAEAEAEAARLRAEGLDVLVRPVDAFSTLGFLADPLWSFMESYGEGELAELVIHETMHATAFRRGGAEAWNEEVATFVGREGARAWLASRPAEAPGREALADWDRGRRASASLVAWLRDTATELEALYRLGVPPEEARARKAHVIAGRAALFKARYDELFEDGRYRDYPMERLNNAWLDLYRLYEGEPDLYRDYFDRVSGGDLRAFIGDMATLAKGKTDPKQAMRAALDALTSSPSP